MVNVIARPLTSDVENSQTMGKIKTTIDSDYDIPVPVWTPSYVTNDDS